MIKIAIVDDQDKYLNILKSQIEKICFDKSFEFKIELFKSGNDFLHYSDNNEKFNILFLDIDMPGINGIDLSRKLYFDEKNTIIVFVTSHSELMAEAFGINVYSFIKKEEIETKLPVIFNTLLNILGQMKNIVLKTEVGYTSFSISSIVAISLETRKLYLYLNNNEKIRIYEHNLSEIAKKLDDRYFIYANRSLLINLHYTKSIQRDQIFTTNNLSFEISKYRKKEIENNFLEFLEEL